MHRDGRQRTIHCITRITVENILKPLLILCDISYFSISSILQHTRTLVLHSASALVVTSIFLSIPTSYVSMQLAWIPFKNTFQLGDNSAEFGEFFEIMWIP